MSNTHTHTHTHTHKRETEPKRTAAEPFHWWPSLRPTANDPSSNAFTGLLPSFSRTECAASAPVLLCNTWPLFGKVLRHVSLHFYLHLAAANRVAMTTHRRVSLHRSHLLNPFVWLHVTLEIFFKRRTTPSSTVLVQVRKTFLKNIVEKKSFPYRESNPSLLGESQLS